MRKCTTGYEVGYLFLTNLTPKVLLLGRQLLSCLAGPLFFGSTWVKVHFRSFDAVCSTLKI
jgi:hypothetical protein